MVLHSYLIQCPLWTTLRTQVGHLAGSEKCQFPDSWNAAKLFARDHLRKNRCTTPKAGLESVAEVVDIYQQATRRTREMKPYVADTALISAVERKYDR